MSTKRRGSVAGGRRAADRCPRRSGQVSARCRIEPLVIVTVSFARNGLGDARSSPPRLAGLGDDSGYALARTCTKLLAPMTWDRLASRLVSWLRGSSQGQRLQPVVADVELQRGQLVGEYAIEQRLGEGGFGSVYSAVHPVIGKPAAVKVLHQRYSANPEMASRFVAEARAANQIRHHNIIDIFSFGVLPDGRHYYVMELLEGVPLDAWLERTGRLEPPEAFALLHGIARALDAAHSAGIAHRDLKPENVFVEVSREGRVSPKLLDFGVAKLLDSSRMRRGHKTQTGSPIGSPRYMSPEQCQGAQVDHRADIYAFGVLAYRMLTGSLPFDAPTALELMMMHVGADIPTLSGAAPHLPAELDAPLAAMLEKAPDKRPGSVIDALDALVAAADHAGLEARAWTSTDLAASAALLEFVGEQRQSILERPPSSLRDPRAAPQSAASALPSRGSRRTTVLVAAAAVSVAIAAGAGIAVQGRRHPGQAAPLLSGARFAQASARPLAPRASSRPAGDTVLVKIEAAPPDAEVFLGADRLGPASSPVSLPRGEQSIELTIKASGYLPLILAVRPSQGMVLRAALKPAPRTGPSPMPTDLENPY